ncbi:hypothetical protein VTN49DRAFT_8027 [Thermomyces lanuginosus]|uniref:uncharacterized protein n=1 Tax=Thermomyces lanuginosus TaxID=5541 RepID=UPI0037445C81
MLCLQSPSHPASTKLDISRLLKHDDEEEAPPPSSAQSEPSPTSSRPASFPSLSTAGSGSQGTSGPLAEAPLTPATTSSRPSTSAGTKRLQGSSHVGEPPAKKQSKWSPEEDALIIELRGRGMKWEDISKRLPGRSAISCRLHYQNYLERRSEWDEDRKNKLARLYERFKAEMWSKVAEEMAIPWRAAEAMHWQLGEQEMARRAGVVPFSLSSSSSHESGSRPRRSNTVIPRGRRQSMSQSQQATKPPAAEPQLGPTQLPSVQDLTAGVPVSGPPQSRHMVDPYRMPPPPPPQLGLPPPPPPPPNYPGPDMTAFPRTRP